MTPKKILQGFEHPPAFAKSGAGFTPLEILTDNTLESQKDNLRGNHRFLMGFTLIELLVVIAIIGLLASIITTAMNNARLKARDARRLSDIKQIKTGLDLYYANGGGYPSDATYDAAYASGQQLSCGSTPVLTVPQDPLYPTYQYDYAAAGTTVNGCGLADLRLQYTITFRLEQNIAILYTMNEDGQFNPPLPGQ